MASKTNIRERKELGIQVSLANTRNTTSGAAAPWGLLRGLERALPLSSPKNLSWMTFLLLLPSSHPTHTFPPSPGTQARLLLTLEPKLVFLGALPRRTRYKLNINMKQDPKGSRPKESGFLAA